MSVTHVQWQSLQNGGLNPAGGCGACVLGQDAKLYICLSPPRSKWVPVRAEMDSP